MCGSKIGAMGRIGLSCLCSIRKGAETDSATRHVEVVEESSNEKYTPTECPSLGNSCLPCGDEVI